MKRWALRTFVERLSALGAVSIGSLEYRLWRGEVTARDVRFEPKGEGALLSAEVEEVQGRWGPFQRLKLTAIRPVVRFRSSSKDSGGERAVPAWPSWLSSLRVVDGDIRVDGETRDRLLELGPFDAELSPDIGPGSARASVEAGGGTLRLGARTVDIFRIDADAVAEGGRLTVSVREIRTEAGDARGEGEIEALGPLAASFDLDFRVDAARMGSVFLDRERIEGELSGSVRIRLADGTFASDGTAEVRSLAFRDFAPVDGSARWDSRDDLLRVNGSFLQGSSRIEAVSVLDLARDEQVFTLEIESPSLIRVLRDILRDQGGGPRAPWDARVTAKLSGRTARFTPETLSGRGIVRLTGRELAGTIDVDAEPGRVVLESPELRFPGGRARGRARVTSFETVAAEYDVALNDLALASGPFVTVPDWVSGELEIRGRTAGSIRDPASLRSSLSIESDDFRLKGKPFVLYARLDQRDTKLDFDRLSLAAAENGARGFASFEGEVDLRRRRMDLLGSLDTFPVHYLVPVESLSTAATGTLTARGSFDRPQGTAAIELSPIEYSNLTLPPVRLQSDSDGNAVFASLTRLDSGDTVANARLPLDGNYVLAADVALHSLPWTELAARLPPSASLSVSGDAHLSVPLRAPSLFEAEVAVENVSVEIRDRVISASAFDLGVRRDRVEVNGLELRFADQALAVDGSLGLTPDAPSGPSERSEPSEPSERSEPSEHARLAIQGAVALELMELWLTGIQAEGLVEVDAELQGSLRAPRLHGSISLDEGRVIESVPSQSTPRAIDNLNLRAEAVGTKIAIQTLRGEVLGGSVEFRGSVPVPGAGTGKDEYLSFDISGADVAPLATFFNGSRGARGSRAVVTSVSVGGRVDFPGGSFERVEASGEIQEVLIASEAGIVTLAAPASFRYREAALTVGEIQLAGDRTDLRVHVKPPAAVSLAGDLDLQLANALMPGTAYLLGVAALDIDAVKSEEGFRFNGEALVSEGELSIERPAFAVTGLSARLELDGDTARVSNLTGRAGGGAIAGTGAFTLPGTGQDEEALRLDLEAERVRLEFPEGMRSEINSRLTLESREGRYRLSGKIDIAQADYRRSISPERELLESLRRKTLSIEGEPGLTGAVDLDLAVSTLRDVVVDNNLGQMRWSAGLLVTGTLAAPEASGTLNAEPGGALSYGRNRYEIENARITLTTYPVEPAELDIHARTEVGGREIALSITGKTDNLRTALDSPSDPTLTRGDVASLLLTGQTLEEVRRTEGDELVQEAAEFVGGGLLSLGESEVAEVLPVTTVRLEPGIVGSETDPGVRFSLGRAVTEDLFLTYSIGLDDAEEQLWIVDYDLPRRLKLRAVREDGNEYTGGVSQVALFDFYERNRPKRLDELPQSKILAIEIQGAIPLPPEEVEEALAVEEGDDYDYWNAREDAEMLSKLLRAAGYRTARVTPVTRPEDAEPGEPLTLIYEVDAGPRVILEFRGESVPGDLEEWARERLGGHIPARAQALRVARELTWELMSRDHYSAAVEASTEGSEVETHVVFDATLGPKGTGVIVDFVGNDRLSDEEIGRLLPKTGSPGFFHLVLGRAEDLKEEIRLLYSPEGYLEARVLELTTRVDPGTAKLEVVFTIEEGERFRVGEVVFEGDERLPEPQLLSEVELRSGEAFRFLAHLSDRQRIASLYRREGFPDARVRSSLERGDGRVDVDFEIEEGDRVLVGEVTIAGAKATREGVIRSALTFEPGGPLRLSDLSESQRRLYNLRVFRSVDMRTEPSEEPSVRNVTVELTELPDLRVGYGARYSTEDQLELTSDFELTNVLGTARQLGFHAFANRRMTELRGSFAVPSFFGRELGSDFFVSRETEEGEGFKSLSWSATFQQGRRVFSGLLAQWSLTHRQAIVRETTPTGPFAFDVEADRTVLAFSLIEDRRSSLTKPRTGRFWNATLSYAPQILGSDLRFLKLYGQFFLYRPVGERAVWASTYRAGIGTGFGQYLLPTDRFRAGGPTSVRGFPVNELGSPDPITGTVIGGEAVVVMNQELRFPLFWRFGGIAFYDAGNVFLRGSDFNPLDLRHTSGLGLSIDLPVGLVTVDWAYLLNPPEDLPRTRWHFTFGYSF